MSTSPARLAANRQNAAKSTGPKSPEGKAASRLNAFQHGMAGSGDLLSPGEDAKLVAERALAFSVELGARDEVGRVLAHRAALLSIRMESAAEREMFAVAAHRADAKAQFDQDRADALAELVADLETSDQPRAILDELAEVPEGVAYLVNAWETLKIKVRSGDDAARGQALLWLGVDDLGDNGKLVSKIDDELARLARLDDSIIRLTRLIALKREQVGILASFDPSPEATLAHRYEATAERGMYRALKAIADHRRDREHGIGNDLSHLLAPPAQAPSPAPTPPTPPQTGPPTPPLGSFRAGGSDLVDPPSKPTFERVQPTISPESTPKKRPDLRELAVSRR